MAEQNREYPQIKVLCKNKTYAKMMLSNVGGKNSEMSAVALYVYNHLMTKEDVAQQFRKISIVEMKHLEIFGKLAKELGANPKLLKISNGHKIWWSPSYLKYYKDLKDILEYSLLGEIKAIDKYSAQKNAIDDPFITEILEYVIEDEKEHVHIFKSLLADL